MVNITDSKDLYFNKFFISTTAMHAERPVLLSLVSRHPCARKQYQQKKRLAKQIYCCNKCMLRATNNAFSLIPSILPKNTRPRAGKTAHTQPLMIFFLLFFILFFFHFVIGIEFSVLARRSLPASGSKPHIYHD